MTHTTNDAAPAKCEFEFQWPPARPVTISQRLTSSPFRGQVVDYWRAGATYYLFVFNPNETMVHLLNTMSIWGGASKRAVVQAENLLKADYPAEVLEWLTQNEVRAWEFACDAISAQQMIRMLNRL